MLSSLKFESPNIAQLNGIHENDWGQVLHFCDRSQLALPLFFRCGGNVPSAVRCRLEENAKDNVERWERLKHAFKLLSSSFDERGIRFIVLKGFSQWPLFVDDPRQRTQYDVDLLFSSEQVFEAARVAASLGYEPAHQRDAHVPMDHLSTMILKTGWTWREDYYDPDMPFSLELHFRCWNKDAEHFGPEGLEEMFWSRTCIRTCEKLHFLSLHPADSVFYSALHILRHILHGNLRAAHVYELAWFLHHHSNDDAFWQGWADLHDEPSQQLQAFCFSLAQRWFSCHLHQAAKASISGLSPDLNQWLDLYSYSPLRAMFRPNKDEIWLHWLFVKSKRERLILLRRKLIPHHLPGPVAGLHTPKECLTWRIRWQSRWRYLMFVMGRVRHHLGALWPAALSASQWFVRSLHSQHVRQRN